MEFVGVKDGVVSMKDIKTTEDKEKFHMPPRGTFSGNVAGITRALGIGFEENQRPTHSLQVRVTPFGRESGFLKAEAGVGQPAWAITLEGLLGLRTFP